VFTRFEGHSRVAPTHSGNHQRLAPGIFYWKSGMRFALLTAETHRRQRDASDCRFAQVKAEDELPPAISMELHVFTIQ